MTRHTHGFTLLEMAVVLAIVALLLGSGLSLVSVQIEQQRIKDTQKTLGDAKEALIGYALINGRLPCPAAPATTGVENPAGGGACTNFNNGFLPAITLGLPGIDSNGYLTDAWGNRIRYAVTAANTNAATTTNGLKNLPMASFTPNLYVCSTSAGTTPTTCGTATAYTATAVAVLTSTGKNPANANPDEAANQNANPVFVSRPQTATFDDQLTWLSSATLFNRMVQAGTLP